MRTRPRHGAPALAAVNLAGLLLLHTPLAWAGVTDVANAVRAHGCPGNPPARQPLRRRGRLDSAARALAAGASLRQALQRADYHDLSSASIHIEGDLSSGTLAQVFRERICAALTRPGATDVGFYQRGDELWLIAAVPFAAPALSDAPRVDREVLARVNVARARGARCGGQWYPPAPPLRSSARLAVAALEHSRDMAQHRYLDHTGRDGSSPAQRIARAGYAWRIVGENVASGPLNAADVAAGWLASPAHCTNIMDARFTETAVAFAFEPSSPGGAYWTEVFAAPR